MLLLLWSVYKLCHALYTSITQPRFRLSPSAHMEHIGRVERLNVFPLKSAAPCSVRHVQCTAMGPRFDDVLDRCLVLADSGGNFLTARKYPTMVLIRTSILSGRRVRLWSERAGELELDLAAMEDDSLVCRVRVWQDKVPALDCGEEAARWATETIHDEDIQVRICYFGSVWTLRDPRESCFPAISMSDGPAFADLTGYMLINTDSVDALNVRLDDSCNADCFRANIVVSPDRKLPFGEDHWDVLAMSNAETLSLQDCVVFENVKPCTRCVLTTVDPQLGKRRIDGQPLKELKRFRLCQQPELKSTMGSSPMFGINLGLRSSGTISVGDSVYVVRQ